MCPEHHVVYGGFVDEVADFDKARHRRHHAKHGHVALFWCTVTEQTFLTCLLKQILRIVNIR